MGRKWNNIKMRKATKDAQTSRLYAKFGIELYVVAKKGGVSPEANGALRIVLERAKAMHVPKHIVDRALDKARDGTGESYEALRYEGFGPQGAMVIVDTLTNNVHRTAADVRAAFAKHGGNLGVPGSCAHAFFDCSVVGAVCAYTQDALLEWLLDAGIEPYDVEVEEDSVFVTGRTDDLLAVQDVFRAHGVQEFSVAETTMHAHHTVTLSGDEEGRCARLLDALEALDDVQRVYHNVE